MILLKNGMVLPVVTTLQIWMRIHRPQTIIKADGQFGPKTKQAVKNFQDFHHLANDGVVGKNSWHKLTDVTGFQTIDVVDGTDSSLVALEANDIRAAGGDPIVVFGMSNGVDFVMSQIAARARPGKVALLRIHGHGNRGMQNVTGGDINGAPHLASISNSNFGQIAGSLAQIKGIFMGYASVQLLGCSVGGRSGGRTLVGRLADTWGVPVTAGFFDQLGGGINTFIFEGPTVTGFPGGATLASWSFEKETAFGNTSMPT